MAYHPHPCSMLPESIVLPAFPESIVLPAFPQAYSVQHTAYTDTATAIPVHIMHAGSQPLHRL